MSKTSRPKQHRPIPSARQVAIREQGEQLRVLGGAPMAEDYLALLEKRDEAAHSILKFYAELGHALIRADSSDAEAEAEADSGRAAIDLADSLGTTPEVLLAALRRSQGSAVRRGAPRPPRALVAAMAERVAELAEQPGLDPASAARGLEAFLLKAPAATRLRPSLTAALTAALGVTPDDAELARRFAEACPTEGDLIGILVLHAPDGRPLEWQLIAAALREGVPPADLHALLKRA